MTRPAVISFYSYKGGVGRTVLAANMALALARRGKTLIWDLDTEAPGMHRIRALRPHGKIKTGFLEWLSRWQADRGPLPGVRDLVAFDSAVCGTPYSNLSMLPAHGDSANPAELYYSIDWRRWLGEDAQRGLDLFESLLGHLGERGFKHVILDARTGLTDLGALISGVLPDATVLIGGYGAQNLGGLAHVWKALKNDTPELVQLRKGRPLPELVLVASPIPQNDPKLLATGREVWAQTFGIELSSVIEIPYDADLPFSEALLYADEDRLIGASYRRLAQVIGDFLDRRDDDAHRSVIEERNRPDAFPRDRHESRVRQGKRFEDRVADLLRLLGYRVEPEQLVGPNRVDLLAEIKSGVDTVTYLVECKDHKGAVAKEVVEKLKVWLDVDKARAMHARGMVVARTFSPAALSLAKATGIRALTPEDLERELLDFTSYVDKIIRSFEQSMLASTYVTQRARLGLSDHRARSDTDSEESPLPRIIGDLVEHGQAWAGGRGSRLWILLGDYGTGKSAFTERLAYDLALAARDDSTAPVPLRINLRELPNKVSLEEVLGTHWQRTTGQTVDPKVLLHLIGRGRIVLLLDSFDEMGIATAGRSVVDQFRSLVGVSATPGDTAIGNRVLITCREQFFREHGEAIRAGAGDTDRISSLEAIAQNFDGALDILERFTPEQVREYLTKRLGETKGREASEFLNRNYLVELADRPQLLDIIVKSLPKLKEREQRTGLPMTVGALYQTYTNEWLDENRPQERQTQSEQLRSILETLAGELWGRPGNRMHYGDLAALFRDRSELRAGIDPNQLDVELRTAAFLSRTPDGYYGFSHRSFLEYFLARRIQRALSSDPSALGQTLDTSRLTPEVSQFVRDLMAGASADEAVAAGHVRAVLLSDGMVPAIATSDAKVNALILGYQLSDRPAARELSLPVRTSQISEYIPDAAQLSGADLTELSLPGVVLRNANLRRARALRIRLDGAVLDGADLSDARLEGASLVGVQSAGARWHRTDCTEADATGINLRETELVSSVWINAHLMRAELERADFSKADLRGMRAAGACGAAVYENAILHGATAPSSDAFLPTISGGAPRTTGLPKLRALHAGAHVWSVAWSPDGTRLATAGDGGARVWDVATGAEVRALAAGGFVGSIAWSPDGTRLATGGEGGARVWDVAAGAEVRALAADSRVLSVAWSPDGTRLATGGEGGARVWDVATGAEVRALAADSRVLSVAWSPDGTRLVTAGAGGVRVWDVAAGAEVRALVAGGFVGSVAWSPDGTRLATGGYGDARVWDVATGAEVRALDAGGFLWSLAWSPDGTRLATGGEGGARVWDVAAGAEVRALAAGGFVGSIAWSPDGTRLATAGDGDARVWDVAAGAEVRALAAGGFVLSVAWSPDGTRLATGGDGGARVWDVATGAEVRALAADSRELSVAWSPDGTRLVTAGDGDARVWDVAAGAEVRALAAGGFVLSVAWSPDGTRLATGGDGDARVWDVATGAEVRALAADSRVLSVAWSPDGTRLATAGGGGARVWDVAAGAEVRALAADSRVLSVAWSPDGTRLATAGGGGARVWDVAAGAEVRALAADSRVLSVAWSPDGTRLVTAGAGGVRVWDVAAGAEVRALAAGGVVGSVAWSPDGTRLATAGDGGVRVWDDATQTLMLQLFSDQAGWAAVDYRTDQRGLWRGRGHALERLVYPEPFDIAYPSPWIPRVYYAVDLPELAAERAESP